MGGRNNLQVQINQQSQMKINEIADCVNQRRSESKALVVLWAFFEKRRFRKFLVFVNDFDAANPTTFQCVDQPSYSTNSASTQTQR